MHYMNIARLVVFAWLLICSVIVLGIASYFCYLTNTAHYYYEAFALAIATAVMTMIAVATSLIVEHLRQGAFTSLVWVELVWTGVLWILWVASAGSITSMPVLNACLANDYYGTSSEFSNICQLFHATEAFSWLAWLTIFGWFWALLICSIIAHTRGHPKVWHNPVTEHAIHTGESEGPMGMEEKVATPSTQIPTASYNPAYGQPQPQGTPYQQTPPAGQQNPGIVVHPSYPQV